MIQSNRFRFRYAAYILVLAAVLILGRAETYFYGIAYTDVAYSDGLVTFLEVVGYLFDSLKYGVLMSAVCGAYWNVSKSDGNKAVIIGIIYAFIENLVRFLIDLISGAAVSSGYGVWVTLMSDGIQMLTDTIFIVICCFIVKLTAKSYLSSNHPRKDRKYSAEKCMLWTGVVLCAYQLVSEISYDIDYLLNTDEIEGSSIAAMAGNFIFVVIFYGLIPVFTAVLIEPLFTVKNEHYINNTINQQTTNS